jgi:hypothetical protein
MVPYQWKLWGEERGVEVQHPSMGLPQVVLNHINTQFGLDYQIQTLSGEQEAHIVSEEYNCYLP